MYAGRDRSKTVAGNKKEESMLFSMACWVKQYALGEEDGGVSCIGKDVSFY